MSIRFFGHFLKVLKSSQILACGFGLLEKHCSDDFFAGLVLVFEK